MFFIANSLPSVTAFYFKSAFVHLPHAYKIEPWRDWTNKQPPNWWLSYNVVKHYRHSSFQRADLGGVVSALTALMISILYFYRLISEKSYTSNHYPEF